MCPRSRWPPKQPNNYHSPLCRSSVPRRLVARELFSFLASLMQFSYLLIDYRLIQGRLGWRPKVGLREGLRRTLEFYRAEKEHYW